MIRIMMAMIIMMVSNLATCPSSPSSSWRSSLPLPSPTLSLWSSKVWSSKFCSHPCLFNKAAEAEWGDWKQPPKHPQKFRAAWNVNYIICYFWWHWNVNVWIFWDPRIPGAPNQSFVCLSNVGVRSTLAVPPQAMLLSEGRIWRCWLDDIGRITEDMRLRA